MHCYSWRSTIVGQGVLEGINFEGEISKEKKIEGEISKEKKIEGEISKE